MRDTEHKLGDEEPDDAYLSDVLSAMHVKLPSEVPTVAGALGWLIDSGLRGRSRMTWAAEEAHP